MAHVITTIIASAAICSTLLLLFYATIIRQRLHASLSTTQRLRWQYVHERQRANALKMSRDKLRGRRDEDFTVFEEMVECNVLLERRAVLLEQRRYVVLRRWWRRRAYRSLVVAWRIGRGPGGAP